jgi:hypothetical protein
VRDEVLYLGNSLGIVGNVKNSESFIEVAFNSPQIVSQVAAGIGYRIAVLGLEDRSFEVIDSNAA